MTRNWAVPVKIQKERKKRGGGVEDMDFPGVGVLKKKHMEIPRVN